MKKKIFKPESVPDNTYHIDLECMNCGHQWEKDVLKGWKVNYYHGDHGTVMENPKNEDREFSILVCPNCQTTEGVRKILRNATGYIENTREDLG